MDRMFLLTAGEPDLPDAKGCRHFHCGDHLILGHHLVMAPLAHALGGHTVATAQIALIRKGDPEICDIPAQSVDHKITS